MQVTQEERETLWQAFLAGFMCSGEGGNFEYPYNFNKKTASKELRPDFEKWLADPEGFAREYRIVE